MSNVIFISNINTKIKKNLIKIIGDKLYYDSQFITYIEPNYCNNIGRILFLIK